MEKTNLKEMIESVLEDISSSTAVENYVLKLKLIAHYLDNKVFKNYINKEFFTGYLASDTIPQYRIISSSLEYEGLVSMLDYGDNMISIKNNNVDISATKIYQSIPELIELCQKEGKLRLNLTQDEDKCIIRPPQLKVYKTISPISLKTIVRDVKSKLVDLIVDLNENVFNDAIDFNVITKKSAIADSVNHNIYAGIVNTGTGIIEITDSTVIGGKENTVTISGDVKQQLQQIVNKIEALSQEVDDDRTDIAEAIIDIRTDLSNTIQVPKTIKKAFNVLKGILGAGEIYELANKGIELLSENN